jgi:hypothetical protein
MADEIATPAEAPPAPVSTPPTAAPVDASPPPVEAKGEPPAKPEVPPEEYEVTVDGQKHRVTRDELLRGYQRGAAARKRFEEANKSTAELQARLDAIKKDPWAILKQAGVDPDQAAQQRIMGIIQREQEQAALAQLSPEIRQVVEEGRKAKEELERLRAEQEAANKGKLTGQAKQFADRWNKALPTEMEKAGLPRTAEAAERVIDAMRTMARAGYLPDIVEACTMVKDELYTRNFSLLRSLPEAQIVEALGKDALDKLQAHLIAQAKGPQPKREEPRAPSQANGKRAWMSETEWTKLNIG